MRKQGKKETVAVCICGHTSNCHHASDMGIHECADCDCQSFHWNGGERVAPEPGRDWITGQKVTR